MAENPEKLTDEIRTYVVQELAGWKDPSVVRAAVKKEFDIDITRQAIQYYDPTTRAGRDLSGEWRTLFFETRKALIDGKVEIGAANKMVRIAWLDEMARKAMAAGNMGMAAQLLEQIAKEMGESYTNKQKHEHSGGIRVDGDLTDAELDERIAAKAAELGLAPIGATGIGAPDRGAGAPEKPQQAQDSIS